ncbi:MAG TPA: hypothetical protein VJH67_03655 [Candidatus Paceibacterota bacterium]
MEAVGKTNTPFIYPSVEKEIGEIERVARELNLGKSFANDFLERSKHTELVELSENDWSRLENTDSFVISVGDWDSVAKNTLAGRLENPRNSELLKSKIESGVVLDAPIVVKIGDVLHLVSGNTRLMVARALGIRPKVLIVDMN